MTISTIAILAMLLLIVLIVVVMARYVRTRRKIERLLTLGPEWAHPRVLDTEIISDYEKQMDALRIRWRRMGPIR